MTLVTSGESLQYDPAALTAGIEKKRKNIKIFEEVITKEQAAIDWNLYVISSIDHKHPDVAKLQELIKKKKDNIKVFREAIGEEEKEIERNRRMIALIQNQKRA